MMMINLVIIVVEKMKQASLLPMVFQIIGRPYNAFTFFKKMWKAIGIKKRPISLCCILSTVMYKS